MTFKVDDAVSDISFALMLSNFVTCKDIQVSELEYGELGLEALCQCLQKILLSRSSVIFPT